MLNNKRVKILKQTRLSWKFYEKLVPDFFPIQN